MAGNRKWFHSLTLLMSQLVEFVFLCLTTQVSLALEASRGEILVSEHPGRISLHFSHGCYLVILGSLCPETIRQGMESASRYG